MEGVLRGSKHEKTNFPRQAQQQMSDEDRKMWGEFAASDISHKTFRKQASVQHVDMLCFQQSASQRHDLVVNCYLGYFCSMCMLQDMQTRLEVHVCDEHHVRMWCIKYTCTDAHAPV